MSNLTQQRNRSIGRITGRLAVAAIFLLAITPAAWASACLTGLAGTSSLAVALEPTVAAAGTAQTGVNKKVLPACTVPAPALSVSPIAINFGSVPGGSSSGSRVATVSNAGKRVILGSAGNAGANIYSIGSLKIDGTIEGQGKVTTTLNVTARLGDMQYAGATTFKKLTLNFDTSTANVSTYSLNVDNANFRHQTGELTVGSVTVKGNDAQATRNVTYNIAGQLAGGRLFVTGNATVNSPTTVVHPPDDSAPNGRTIDIFQSNGTMTNGLASVITVPTSFTYAVNMTHCGTPRLRQIVVNVRRFTFPPGTNGAGFGNNTLFA